MFRLDKDINEQRMRLSLAGEMTAECIALLETYCQQALKDGKTVDLVLRDVTTIDEAGHALLHRLAARGVCLSGSGLYLSYLVDTIRQRVSPEDASNILESRLREGS